MHRVDRSDERPATHRLRLDLGGAVQGVGFRPCVYRLATAMSLCGWVNNSVRGVAIEVEGSREQLEAFQTLLQAELPPPARIDRLDACWLPVVGYDTFAIAASASDDCGEKSAVVLPDLATCSECLAEILDPRDRRYRYPFTNCTTCGPRYTLIEALPYDRANTTMRAFAMCPDCRAEYEDPRDRRFHAQPNACPRCGPHLEFWSNEAKTGDLAVQPGDLDRKRPLQGERALRETVRRLRSGQILAVKGLGGFHLLVDARNPTAVAQLRARKQRPDKPFALMFPSLADVEKACWVSAREAALLQSPACPIVLLRKRPHARITPAVAPGNPTLGVMLPYTPLHHLLLSALGVPVVATSGNAAGEPICTNEREAVQRLGTIADGFLVHNRPIARPVDDSVARVVLDRPVVLRRARGYAPFPTDIDLARFGSTHGRTEGTPTPNILALGGHLKNTIALYRAEQAVLGQHIGDLETPRAFSTFTDAIASLSALHAFRPEAIACDLHPDYRSSRYARDLAETRHLPLLPVQHHLAHILAVVAEHRLALPVLGIAWDGAGYGPDGTLWGGEFISVTETTWRRVACWRPFRLPGGERALREPRRIALGLLYEVFGDEVFADSGWVPVRDFPPRSLPLLHAMLRQHLNSPVTTSVGRLFDAIAALLDLCQTASFEGQGAMALEFAAAARDTDATYPIAIRPGTAGTPDYLDWEPMVRALACDLQRGGDRGLVAATFHNTLVAGAIAIAKRTNATTLIFTGGCFQNRYLLERCARTARERGFHPYWPQLIPPNDGGIALGQVIAALLRLRRIDSQTTYGEAIG